MWQPRARQWALIWPVALLLILAWPPAEERSLGVKAMNWMADPLQSLPALPAPLPMGLEDDGDAVAAHDQQAAAYYNAYDSSGTVRRRMTLKEWTDPADPSTERQLLVGIAVVAALIVWRLERRL